MYPSWVRVLGVDYGDRRIGLALSDASGTLARPWKTIEREGNPAQVAAALGHQVRELAAQDEQVEVIVLGYPRKLNGEPTHQTTVVQQLYDALSKSMTGARVVLQDERLSSQEAEARLAVREKDWRKRKRLLDAAAAAIILQDYLDSNGRADRPLGETEP